MKKVLVILTGMILLLSVLVTAGMILPVNDKAKGHSSVINENGALDRIDFVHYAKPDNPGKPDKLGKQEKCYKLLGVKWKTLPVDYVINPTNPGDLSEEFVTSAISTSAETWDVATSSELFKDIYKVNYSLQYGTQDFKNVISFGNYPQENVIGVTSIWYTRRGKQIVEFDILFDTDFTWGDATVDPSVMDLQNIATHELGHAVGLGDLYDTVCAEETMYGYSDYGETKKRDLNDGDIAGIKSLY